MNIQRFCFAVCLFALMIAAGSASAVCSNASLNGVVGYVTTAWGAGVGLGGASVGQITYDGKGSFTAVATDSAFGTIEPVTYSGTYSVAKNCTGISNITSSPQGSFSFVLDDTKKGSQAIETDGTYIASGFAFAQGSANCGLTGKKQTLAANLAGTVISDFGPRLGVGQVVLDGKGGVSGSATFNLDGTLISGPITGTYTENSNCTGTAQITLNDFTTNYYLVVVDSGKELLAIETDNDTVVAGTLQE